MYKIKSYYNAAVEMRFWLLLLQNILQIWLLFNVECSKVTGVKNSFSRRPHFSR